MKRVLLSTTMFGTPLNVPSALDALTAFLTPPPAPKDDMIDAIFEAKRLMMEADADPRTWPREGWFDGQMGTFTPTHAGLAFTPYPKNRNSRT